MSVQVGMGGAAVCYSYSCSKGAYAGVSIEGSLLTTRNDVNLNFYGETSPLVEGSSALQCHPVIGFTLVFHNIVCVSVGYGELLPAVDLSWALKEDFLSSVERRMHCMSAEQRFLCCSFPLLSG